MTELEAQKLATALWGAQGAWTEASIRTSYDKHGNATKIDVCEVGICREAARAVERFVIGEGATWEIAMGKASAWWDAQRPRKVSRKRPGDLAVAKGGLPMAGELL